MDDADLATAGRILIRFLTTVGEWSEIYSNGIQAALQIDGTVDITPAEAELLRRLTGNGDG